VGRIKKYTFGVFVALFIVAAQTGALANDWRSWGSQYGCSMVAWSQFNELTGWCDCNDEEMGCLSAGEEFCQSFEDACEDFCFEESCGVAEVTDCTPQLVGYVECVCDFCS
jgi:hypothetical protein